MRTFGINLSRRFIIASLVLFIFTGCNSVNAPSFAGTVLSQAPEATDFTLLDQFGETITLADYKNQVVVLTFVYTACNDICPLIAHRLKEAEKYLIDAADEIAILLISVDPDRDTVSNRQEFLNSYGMVTKWKYLVGQEKELEDIWSAYYVSSLINESDAYSGQSNSRDALETELLNNYSVTHQGPVYLIDRTGHARSIFTLPFDSEDLANDIKLLVKEN